MAQMNYDVVLATRNRQRILKISVPLMLSQTRLPRRLIVVDSSDDHRGVCDVVQEAVRRTGKAVKLRILQSEAGSSLQRNVGLQHVESPVVILPDDDALWFPDSADALMRVYERDEEKRIGCVAYGSSSLYPSGCFDSGTRPYELEFRDRLSERLETLVGSIEDRYLPDPMLPGRMWTQVWGTKTGPSWLDEEEAELCGPVFGYRMSFRTSVIRSFGGFDEHLGRYAMFEDSDATIGALGRSLNVLAKRARVYHYRVPGERLNGWEFGMQAVLNRTYIVCKHSKAEASVRRFLKRYLRYKILRYMAQSHTLYGRQRLRGALYGMSRVHELLSASADKLTSCYIAARDPLPPGAPSVVKEC